MGTQETSVTADTAQCVVCRQPIPTGARKCTTCGSFQSWIRYLTFSNSVLSLLIALLSVSALGIPVIVNALKAPDAFVRGTVLDAYMMTVPIADGSRIQALFIQVYVTNAGKRTGVIGTSAEFKDLSRSAESGWHEIELYQADLKARKNIVDPEETSIIEFVIRKQDRIPEHFLLRFKVTKFEHTTEHVEMEYKAPSRD